MIDFCLVVLSVDTEFWRWQRCVSHQHIVTLFFLF